MADPDRASHSTSAAEESFFDILDETLRSLDRAVRGQFLTRFFKAFASVELSESQSVDLWDRILARHREHADQGAGVSVKAAMVDVLQALDLIQVPVLVGYRELRELQVSARTDALTGLYNRRLFEEHLDKEVSRAQRSGGQLALVILDLHRFKEVNDQNGHQAGDRALRLVADAARDTLRASDFAFRIGGDEFAVLLPQCDLERCAALSRRLKSRYETLVGQLALEVPVALDYGIAVLPEDGRLPDDLVRVADRRLYEMKSGRRSGASPETAHPSGADKRKWKRTPLIGTSAHAVCNRPAPAMVPMVDVSSGGVALLLPDVDVFPAEFSAVLHVPSAPPVEVILHKTYAQPAGESGTRVGCAFVSRS